LREILKQRGEKAKVGEVIARIGGDGKAPGKESRKGKEKAKEQATKSESREPSGGKAAGKRKESTSEPDGKERHREETTGGREAVKDASGTGGEARKAGKAVMPAARRLMEEHDLDPEDIRASGSGGRLLKEDVQRHLEKRGKGGAQKEGAERVEGRQGDGDREEEVVPMSPLRRTVARRLVEARQTAALLTTFNEIDMTSVMTFRKAYQEVFQKKHGIKLGFMSLFVKASIDALKRFPQVNAEVRGEEIVYRNYQDIGVAVGGGKGLVVPVLRNAERVSFAEIERTIADFAKRAEENRLKLEELQGGTFTISNGGVYGSLMSTPIVNPPQSGILGLHAIQDRPVAIEGSVVIRPMMYVALTYDHRIVDGREAVLFLRRIKEVVERPTRLLVEV
jgi:2-oxoglutarate dehydrogenase E2 component (dihydrolipoamide succinyltransferase)